jgi:hypothetical protein
MAKVIEFYVPTSFHQKVKWTSSPVRNEVIELCPHDEGETKIIAVFEEVVRVEQYLVLKEEVWILRGRATLDSLELLANTDLHTNSNTDRNARCI